MPIIDFRLRPPLKGFLDMALYSAAERRGVNLGQNGVVTCAGDTRKGKGDVRLFKVIIAPDITAAKFGRGGRAFFPLGQVFEQRLCELDQTCMLQCAGAD